MARKKKSVSKKKRSLVKVTAANKAKSAKPSAKKLIGKSTQSKKTVPKKKAKKPVSTKPTDRTSESTLSGDTFIVGRRPRGRGLGSGAGGQSGDIQGLSRGENIDSESVEELAEEGQDFEAGVVRGIENALDPDEGEVETEEVLEDDVPLEYDGQE